MVKVWVVQNVTISGTAYNFCAADVQPAVKILKIGTPEIITILVLQLEQLDFTVQYCVQKMQTD